jgi:opacity protein-like surface antigen
MQTMTRLRTRVLLGATAALAAAALILVIGASAAVAAGPNTSFAFNARGIGGAVALTGGGAFGSSSHPAHSGGGFRCTSPVSSGPLAGCQTGEGVRWDSDTLLTGTNFRCVANEALKPVSTSDGTVVLHADFYRAGDGIDESFNANMFVSTHDIDNDIPGVQNVWVQGVGCATAAVHFSP